MTVDANPLLANLKILTKKCILRSRVANLSGYIDYVFEDLEYSNSDFKYIWAIQFPNWDQQEIEVGSVGFLNFHFVEAGKDEWYDKVTQEFVKHKGTYIQLLKFVKEQPVPVIKYNSNEKFD